MSFFMTKPHIRTPILQGIEQADQWKKEKNENPIYQKLKNKIITHLENKL